MDCTFYPAKLSGVCAAPASKSEAHRRMICAGLSRETVCLNSFMESGDMAATERCLQALGADVRREGGALSLRGFARPAERVPEMDCGESGSTLRFFVPLALALTGGAVFRMHGRLGQRPMDVYRDLFVPRGVSWRMGVGADGAAELTVIGRIEPGDYALPGNVSSQFVSGLLFALPLLGGHSTLTVMPPVESAGYIRMTVEALTRSGIVIRETAPFTWDIPGAQCYHAESGPLSGDYSQSAVLLCAAALGHPVTVTGLNAETTQGDRAILRHLAALGASVEERDGAITVVGPTTHAAVIDLHDSPDIAPILALVCQLTPGESRLTHCGRLRLKETDRLVATASILNALGGHTRIDGDDLVITGQASLAGGTTVDGFGDHRMVMLASIAASVAQAPVTVTGVEALEKSWPDYLRVYQSLGGQVK